MRAAARFRTWKVRLGITSVLAVLATFLVGVQPAMAAQPTISGISPATGRIWDIQ